MLYAKTLRVCGCGDMDVDIHNRLYCASCKPSPLAPYEKYRRSCADLWHTYTAHEKLPPHFPKLSDSVVQDQLVRRHVLLFHLHRVTRLIRMCQPYRMGLPAY